MKNLMLAGVSALCLLALPAAAAEIDAARIADHIKVLSSDAFEGRGPNTPGEVKTVDYLTKQFQAVGLKPGGDLKNGVRSWTQDVPLARFETKGPVKVEVDTGAGVQTWTQGEEIAIRAASTGIDRLTVTNAPIVFVGYGVTAPERNWDDFKGQDLKGKVALVLINDPDFETGQGDFAGKAMTYETAPLETKTIVVEVQATGNIQPTTEVEVSSERSGVIRTVNVKANSVVKQGDVLAELDTERLQAELARGKAAIAAWRDSIARRTSAERGPIVSLSSRRRRSAKRPCSREVSVRRPSMRLEAACCSRSCRRSTEPPSSPTASTLPTSARAR